MKPLLVIWLRLVPIMLLLMLLGWTAGGCIPPTTAPPVPPVSTASVALTHEPMHPDNTQTVTFQAEATGNVDRVVIEYERYALSTSSGGNHQQTLAEARTTLTTCDPPATTAAVSCSGSTTSAFAANSLIKVFATVVDDSGNSAVESYFFAAGDYPWPNDPIPIRTHGTTSASLDIVFIPDTDITLSNFRSQLDEVVENLYFHYSAIQDYRSVYNFYYSGVQGDYEELCSFTNPANMASLSAVADTVVILHDTDLRDCRSGNRMASEIDYDKTLIHESGHALFDLQDEYCCDSSYSPQACQPNIWSSLSACQTAAPSIGLAASNCTQHSDGTNTLNYWYIDPTGATGCMMGDSQHLAGSDFGPACVKRIHWRYGKCAAGNCYPWPACP